MRTSAAVQTSRMPTAAEVFAAARRLRGVTRRTPLRFSPPLSAASGVSVLLKLENLQRTGSFKLRGAANAILSLPPAAAARGVVTASAGNHGLGVALAARFAGIAATIFVPATAPRVKRDRIGQLGARLREVDGGYDAAHSLAEEYASATGAPYIHAFSDPATVAGQGTVALEIVQQLPTVRTLLVPVGGGGLLGGVGTLLRDWERRTGRRVRLIGVQSVQTAAMFHSLRAGRVTPVPNPPTLCDGLAGDVDAPSLALVASVVDEIVLVEEEAVRRAIRRLYRESGLAVEGSAATVAAAVRENLLPRIEGPVVAVMSGGNIDPELLHEITA